MCKGSFFLSVLNPVRKQDDEGDKPVNFHIIALRKETDPPKTFPCRCLVEMQWLRERERDENTPQVTEISGE